MIDLEGHDQYERLILTTRHGLALVKALRLDVAEEASDVVDMRRDRGARPAKKNAGAQGSAPRSRDLNVKTL